MKISYLYVAIAFAFLTAVAILIAHIPSIEQPFTPIEITTSKCLDGSNYKFLFSKGTTSKDKFLLFFEGGGMCGINVDPLEDCEKRAQGEFGSSKYHSILARFVFSRYSRIFSGKKEYNPLFHDWNKVYIRYCDGMTHTGDSEITTPRNIKLYFHGDRNVVDTISYLVDNYSFKTASKVVLTGSSAGGFAVTMWANYIKKQTSSTTQWYMINDSGFPLDYTDIHGHDKMKESFQGILKATSLDTYYPKSKIREDYCNEPIDTFWKCYFPQLYLRKVTLPTLLLHSQYDNWMISTLTGVRCIVTSNKMLNSCTSEEKAILKAYADSFTKVIDEQMTAKNDLSVWLPRTLTHTFFVFTDAWDNEAWKVGNEKKATLNEVLREWMNAVDNKQTLKYVDVNNDKMEWLFLKDLLWYQQFLTTN